VEIRHYFELVDILISDIQISWYTDY